MAVPTRMEKYRESGQAFTNVRVDQAVLDRLSEIAKNRGVPRSEIIADACAVYVKHHPSIERAQTIEQALCYGDVAALKALQGDDTDAEFAARCGIAERTWRAYRLGEYISTASLKMAAKKRS